MPLKIAGSEMITIDALIVAISMPSVVLRQRDPLVVRVILEKSDVSVLLLAAASRVLMRIHPRCAVSCLV